MRELPHLVQLQAFEAAARHLSFTRAADGLNCTQAAISQRVRGGWNIISAGPCSIAGQAGWT